MAERKLVTVERVIAVRSIQGADAIEAVTVRGWTVVTRRGEFLPGDLCVYFELDSFLPTSDARFAFLGSRGDKSVGGREGHVLRTIKLRGVYSQGLALPIAAFRAELGDAEALLQSGEDIAERLGVTKYEPPIPANLKGEIIGPFPTQFAPKTDAERVQNLVEVYALLRTGARWRATEKIDGSCVTFARDGGRLRICSRNLELVPEGTTQAKLAEEMGLLSLLTDGEAVQAEVFGAGIQKNPLNIRGQRLAVFALWRERCLVPRSSWPKALQEFAAPVYEDLTLPNTVAEAIAQVDGIQSQVNPSHLAEGIVWHTTEGETFDVLDGRGCFKAISNKWLLRRT